MNEERWPQLNELIEQLNTSHNQAQLLVHWYDFEAEQEERKLLEQYATELNRMIVGIGGLAYADTGGVKP